MKIKGGLFITPRDIMLITGNRGLRVAQREHLEIRRELGLKTRRLTIKQYCDYWKMDFFSTIAYLHENRI